MKVTEANNSRNVDNVKIVEMLVNCGAIVNQAANDGATPLHFAAMEGKSRRRI